MLSQLRMYLSILIVSILSASSVGCTGTGCKGGACHGVGSGTALADSLNSRSSGPLPTTVSGGAAQGAVSATPTTASPSQLPELNQTTQQFCPVTGAKLGSMGEPVPVVIGGQSIYVCCAGCVEKVKQTRENICTQAEHPGRRTTTASRILITERQTSSRACLRTNLANVLVHCVVTDTATT